MSIPLVNDRFTRIGLFIDGGFFALVSEYYGVHHSRKSRISFNGLQNFVVARVAKEEGVEVKNCRLVDAHYFRGRSLASSVDLPSRLMSERQFDESLMRTGITAHYTFLTAPKETAIDVWLALEAYEQTLLKRFDVVVLVAGDGDHVPLVKKLNAIGARVMVLAWNFSWEVLNQQDNTKEERSTYTSSALLNEASYPVLMHELIDDPDNADDALVNRLFIPLKEKQTEPDLGGGPAATAEAEKHVPKVIGRETGTVCDIDNDRMFGLIQRNKGQKIIFFPNCFSEGSFVLASIGTEVEFDVVRDPGYVRPRAQKIRILDKKKGQ